MHRFFLTSIITAFLSFSACSQGEESISLNQEAPAIKIGQWLGDIPDLEGKVVVIDFWFVNCGPCVASIPHLNTLAEAFAEEEVVFLAITDDPKKKVLDFQESRRISFKSYVGIDRLNRTGKRFGVKAYPQSYLIDREGILRWAGSPLALSASVINKVLGKNEVNVDSELAEFKNDTEHLIIRKSAHRTGLIKEDEPDKNTMRSVYIGMGLQHLISRVSEQPAFMVEVPQEEANRYYDLTYENTAYQGDKPVHSARFLELVLSELGYDIVPAQVEVSGYSLQVADESTLSKYESSSAQAYFDNQSIKGTIALTQLGLELSKALGEVVKVQTETSAKYKFDLDLTDQQQLKDQLLRKYGLRLSKGRVRVEKLVAISLSQN